MHQKQQKHVNFTVTRAAMLAAILEVVSHVKKCQNVFCFNVEMPRSSLQQKKLCWEFF